MKILVLGAGGMAGHVVSIRLQELGYTVAGFARKKLSFCETITGDAMTANLPEIIKDYDAVINCIGILNKAVDANPHKGIWINSYLPHLLSIHAKRVIHLSTDCVFSGRNGGNHKEGSFKSADTLYGRSKALGELNNSKDLTIRTSIIGPDINENGTGLFNWFMKQSDTADGYTGAIWSGVTTIVLANAIHFALEQEITDLCHLTNGEKICKFELLKLFNELRKNPLEIKPSDVVNEDKSLVCTRFDFDFKVPTYEEMVNGIKYWVNKHELLYLHYQGLLS